MDFKGIHIFKLTVFNLCLSCSPLSVSLSFKSFCFHSFFDLVSSGGCCLIFACCPARLRWTTSRPGTSLSLSLSWLSVSHPVIDLDHPPSQEIQPRPQASSHHLPIVCIVSGSLCLFLLSVIPQITEVLLLG